MSEKDRLEKVKSSSKALKKRTLTKHGVFVLEISEAKDLVGSKGIVDAYVKVHHEGIVAKHCKWTTTTKHKTANPRWTNEQCTGFIMHPRTFEIKLRVFDDEGQWKSDECLGQISLSVNKPQEFVEGWYPLESDRKARCKGGQLKIALSLKYGPNCVTVLEEIFAKNTMLNRDPMSTSQAQLSPLTISRTTRPTKQATVFECIKKNDAPAFLAFIAKCKPTDLNELDSDGNSPLHLACLDCKKLDRKILHGLLNYRGINLNIPNLSRNTPLHYFCAQWEDPNLYLLDLFIAQGADINAVNAGGETPLFKAIANNSIRKPLMAYLLKQGADPTQVNSKGDRLLHYACRMGRSDIVDLILQYSNDLNIKGADDLTPAQICAKYALEQADDEAKLNYLGIQEQLMKTAELFAFLDQGGLSCDKAFFIRQELDLELLLELPDEHVLELPDLPLGRKYRLLAGLKKRRESHPKEKKETLDEKLAAIRSLQAYGRRKSRPLNMEKLQRELKTLSSNDSDITFIPHAQLEFLDELGRGAFGVVYKGYLKVGSSPRVEVAIKTLLQHGEEEIEDFKKELRILHLVQHENIVGFFGVCLEGSPALVMEYCASGSLNSNLKDLKTSWRWLDFFRVCKGCINGLHALHTHVPQILHRDLKSLNILMTPEGGVKVADFGLSRENTSLSSETLKVLQGTAHYMAPEVLMGNKYTTKADVYSLGMILWEIMFRVVCGFYQAPYAEYPDIAGPGATLVLLLKVTSGLRPTIPAQCPQIIRELITACIIDKPEDRPELLGVLAVIEKARAVQEAALPGDPTWTLSKRVPPPKDTECIPSNDSLYPSTQRHSKSTGSIRQRPETVVTEHRKSAGPSSDSLSQTPDASAGRRLERIQSQGNNEEAEKRIHHHHHHHHHHDKSKHSSPETTVRGTPRTMRLSGDPEPSKQANVKLTIESKVSDQPKHSRKSHDKLTGERISAKSSNDRLDRPERTSAKSSAEKLERSDLKLLAATDDEKRGLHRPQSTERLREGLKGSGDKHSLSTTSSRDRTPTQSPPLPRKNSKLEAKRISTDKLSLATSTSDKQDKSPPGSHRGAAPDRVERADSKWRKQSGEKAHSEIIKTHRVSADAEKSRGSDRIADRKTVTTDKIERDRIGSTSKSSVTCEALERPSRGKGTRSPEKNSRSSIDREREKEKSPPN